MALQTMDAREWVVLLIGGIFLLIIGVPVTSLILGLGVTRKSKVTEEIPLVGSQLPRGQRKQFYLEHCTMLLLQAHEMHRSGTPMVRMETSEGEVLVMHPRYLPELRLLPDEVLANKQAIELFTLARFSFIGQGITPFAKHVLKMDLTRALPRLAHRLAEEADQALRRVVGPCDEWTEVPTYAVVQDIVSQVFARVFVGLPMCRDLEWLEVASKYPNLAIKTMMAMQRYPTWLRPLMFLARRETRALLRVRNKAMALMRRLAEQREKKTIWQERLAKVDDDNAMDDMLQWIIAKSGPSWGRDYKAQAELLVGLALAGNHTVTAALVHMIYDLATYPQVQQPLVDEIRQALDQTDGVFTHATVRRLVKLDSFMKESQRYNPGGLTTFQRLAVRDIRLSDGLVIPRNTRMLFSRVQYEYDADLVPNPREFQPWRFVALEKERPGYYQYVCSNADSLHYGQGAHACPGRFFAGHEIKAILAHILLAYEIKLLPGHQERPANMTQAMMVSFHMNTITMTSRGSCGANIGINPDGSQ